MIPIANNEPDLNISEVIRDIQLGLKVIRIASVQAIQKRRLDLCYKLVGAAKELADPSKPFDDTIFGPNLKQHFTSILNVNKITNKMTCNCSKGGNRFHPFLEPARPAPSQRELWYLWLSQPAAAAAAIPAAAAAVSQPKPKRQPVVKHITQLQPTMPEHPQLSPQKQLKRAQQTKAVTDHAVKNPQPTTSSQNDQVIHLFPKLPKPDVPVGSHLQHFISNWYKISKDQCILEMVSGCPTDLADDWSLPSDNTVHEIKLSPKDDLFSQNHIEELLTKNAIRPCSRTWGDFVSPVFLCPKKDGGYRMILNLKKFNTYAVQLSFKMELFSPSSTLWRRILIKLALM